MSTSASSLNLLLRVIRKIAQKHVMPFFPKTRFAYKGDGNLGKYIDLTTQRILQSALYKIIAVPVLGEEMSQSTQQRLWQDNCEGLWVVDPIDGTTNFVRGISHFSISVAFFQRGQPQFGAVYNPVTDEMFYACAGKGAYLNGVRLPIFSSANTLNEAVAIVGYRHLPNTLLLKMLSNPPCHSHRTFGASTLDWCYLAAGRIELYIHGGQNLWDYAAGCLILREAGGQFTTLSQQSYWTADWWRRSVIASSNTSLFSMWLAWISSNSEIN